MRNISRGFLIGAAFGLASTCFQTWMGVSKMMSLRMPPVPLPLARAMFLEVALAAGIGVFLAPLLRLPRGGIWHGLGLALAWLVLARTVAPDPAAVGMWAAPPVVALLLLVVGLRVARRSPSLPWVVGAAVAAAAVVVPVAVHERRTASETPSPIAAKGVSAAHDAPDVLLVVLDTVRARNMSAYGYERPTTPYFDRLAEESALFLDATAPSTWSLPSHASLFTGRFPSGHGAHGEYRYLSERFPTLAQVLAAAGYETRCFTANPHISDAFGLTRGFQWSDRAWLGATGGRSFIFAYRVLDLLGWSARDKGGGDVATNFERWVASRDRSSRPTFAFINFLEAHFPYHQVPPEVLARFTDRSRRSLRAASLAAFGAQFGRSLTPAEVERIRGPARDMYDAGVLYSDYLLSRVVEALRAAGRLDRTVLVVLADHGEMLGEHGEFGHGPAMYEPDLRVPLLVRYPPRVRGGSRVAEPVSTVGVFATVMDLAGLEIPSGLHVRSLARLIDGDPGAAVGPVLAERYAMIDTHGGASALGMRDRRYRVYRRRNLKLVTTSTGETFLFDLARDPAETSDLAARERELVAELRGEFDDWRATLALPAIDAPLSDGEAPELDPAVRERLKALGYVE